MHNSISEDFVRYCESQKLGMCGIDLFAHTIPSLEDCPKGIFFMEMADGVQFRTISGKVSCQEEYVVVTARAESEKAARTLLNGVIEKLDIMTKVPIGNSLYMSVYTSSPIRCIGTDKNGRVLCEVDMAVLRQ